MKNDANEKVYQVHLRIAAPDLNTALQQIQKVTSSGTTEVIRVGLDEPFLQRQTAEAWGGGAT